MKITPRFIRFNPSARVESAGLTLAELLIVAGIIGILAALLVAGCGKAEREASEVVCLKNQKELMTGFLKYAGDNQDEILPEEGNRAGGFWKGPRKDGSDTPILPGMTRDEAQAAVEAGLKESPLSKYLVPFTAYHCPADFRVARPKRSLGWGYDSYSKVNGMNGGSGWKNQVPYKKLSEVLEPAVATVFLEEADPRGFSQGSWVMNVPPSPGWVDVVAVFHGQASTISFVDGHAELHQWVDASTIKAGTESAQGKGDFFEPGGDSRNPDFRWVYERYKHAKWTPLN